MAKSYEGVKDVISVIKNEVEDGRNTAQRVGGAMDDIVDYTKESLEAQEERINEGTDIKISELVVQETGEGENVVMSQNAVSEKLNEIKSKMAVFLPKGKLKIDYTEKTLTIPDDSVIRVGNSGIIVGGTIPLLEDYYTSLMLVYNYESNSLFVKRYNYELKESEQFIGAFTVDYGKKKVTASFGLPFENKLTGIYSTRQSLIYNEETGVLTIPQGGTVTIDGVTYVVDEQDVIFRYANVGTNNFGILCYNISTKQFNIYNYDTAFPVDDVCVDIIRVSLNDDTPNAVWSVYNNPIRFSGNKVSLNGYGESLLYDLCNPITIVNNASFVVGDARVYNTRLTFSKKLPSHYNKIISKISVSENSPYKVGLQVIDYRGNVVNESAWVNQSESWEQIYTKDDGVVIQWVTTRIDGGSVDYNWENALAYITIYTEIYGNAQQQFNANLANTKITCRGKSGFDIIAHRGYHFTGVPENSLDSYRIAAKMGYKYVETDVHLTSDGVAVICHDDTINRTFRNLDYSTISETIYIRNTTYAELASKYIQVSATKKYRKPIPTLQDFLTLCKKYSLFPILEIKENIDQLTLETYNLASKMIGDGNFGFIGFHYKQLDYARTLSNNSMVIYIGNGILDTNNTVNSQSRNNHLNVWFPWSGYTPVVTKDIIEQYHANGMKVVCYPETNDAYNQCTDWGYDMAVSNYISPDIDGKAGFVASSEFNWYDFTLTDCATDSSVEGIFDNPKVVMPEGSSVSVSCPSEVMIAGVFINIVAKGKFSISDNKNTSVIDCDEVKEFSFGLMVLSTTFNYDKNHYYAIRPKLTITSEEEGSELHSVDFNVVKYW